MIDRGDNNSSRDVSRELAGRLSALGVGLTGRETAEELADVEDAVAEFEAEVEAHGGDLMVDEAPRGRKAQPDDPAFVLPARPAHEPVAKYLERLARATDKLRSRRAEK